ncbi:alpha/beta hydrolase [Kribbella sp. NPDC023855]|uniref:alpha/beta hydrolase n=1 Tax=Kribbella sp. NPDC023855 TaxID=3154698 RepID=UPI0033C66408
MLKLYREGRQREVLELLEEVDADLAPWSAELAHFEACMHGSLGDADAALKVLQRASAAGAWWHESLLVEDDDLAVLRDRPELAELVKVSRERTANGVASWTVQLPDGDAAVAGVVVALHGAGQHAARAAQDWASVVGLGYALVAIDSSQLISTKFRTWFDRDLTVRDIAAALADLPEELRGLPVIAAGFSNGGRAALEWALTAGPVPVDGVILLGPSLRELPATAANPLSPATIFVGTEDNALAGVDRAADQLTSLGFDIVRIPGLNHTAPPDLADRLAQLLG